MSPLDANWHVDLGEGQAPDQVIDLLPWPFSDCVSEDGEPIVLGASPATFLRTIGDLTPDDRELFERWPFSMPLKGEDPSTASVTCLRLLHHRMYSIEPSITLDDTISMLLDMEKAGQIEWQPEEYRYLDHAILSTSDTVPDWPRGIQQASQGTERARSETGGASNDVIRRWARSRGRAVANYGRIPREIREEFELAHP